MSSLPESRLGERVFGRPGLGTSGPCPAANGFLPSQADFRFGVDLAQQLAPLSPVSSAATAQALVLFGTGRLSRNVWPGVGDQTLHLRAEAAAASLGRMTFPKALTSEDALCAYSVLANVSVSR